MLRAHAKWAKGAISGVCRSAAETRYAGALPVRDKAEDIRRVLAELGHADRQLQRLRPRGLRGGSSRYFGPRHNEGPVHHYEERRTTSLKNALLTLAETP